MTVSVSELTQRWMAGWLIDDNCNVGPLQSIILEFTWRAWLKTVKSLHQGSLHVLADIKPSIPTTKVRSITSWDNLYGNGLKKKNSRRRRRRRRRRKRERVGTQKPVRIVSCPHGKLCILWIRCIATCRRWCLYNDLL